MHHLTHCLLCRQRPLCLEEEVAREEDYTDNDTINNNATVNDGDKEMPPKAKPAVVDVAAVAKKKAPVAKKTTGDESDEVAVMPPRAPAKKNFLMDVSGRFLVAYYGKGINDYTDVAIMVNDTIKKGSYDVQVDKDGHSLSW